MSKILVIEDNEDNLDMISRRLIRKEFEVVSAMDGVTARMGSNANQTTVFRYILALLSKPDLMELVRKRTEPAPTGLSRHVCSSVLIMVFGLRGFSRN